jgi:hypothetical protein
MKRARPALFVIHVLLFVRPVLLSGHLVAFSSSGLHRIVSTGLVEDIHGMFSSFVYCVEVKQILFTEDE